MEESLINLNQLCANGLVVDMCPKQYSLHGIYHEEDDLFILFCMYGCTSYFFFMVTNSKGDWQLLTDCFYIQTGMGPIFSDFCSTWIGLQNREWGATEGEFFTNAWAAICMNIGGTSSHNRCSTVNATTLDQWWVTSIEPISITLIILTTCAIWFYPEDAFCCHFQKAGTTLLSTPSYQVVFRYLGDLGDFHSLKVWISIWTTVL